MKILLMTKIHPYIICLIFNAIFSTHYLVAKIVLSSGVSPFSLSALRGLGGGIILLCLARKDLTARSVKPSLPLLFLLALLGFFLNQIFFMKGLALSSPVNAALLGNMIPVVSLFYALIFKLEWVSLRKMIGIILGFICISFLIIQKGKNELEFLNLGNLLMLINVFFFCGSLIVAKKIFDRGLSPLIATGTMLTIGGVGLFFFSPNYLLDIYSYSTESLTNLGFIFFEVVVSTAFVYLLNFWCLKKLAITKVTFFNYTQPLFSLLLAVLIGQEYFEIKLILIYLGVIFSGYLLLSTGKSKERQSHSS
jgi:drug/metabolite transporter (DMT)-like permease